MNKEQETTIKQLEKRILLLEESSSKKDVWDIVSILSSFLIPISIFFGGLWLSKSQEETKLANDKQELSLARISSDVEQARLVAVFLDALVDSNAYKRQLAIKSLDLALKEKASGLLEEISDIDPDTNVQQYAQKVLVNNIEKNIYTEDDLESNIENIFSSDTYTRKKYTNILMNDFSSDPNLVPELLRQASMHFGNTTGEINGIVNTIVILNRVDRNLLIENKELFIAFAKEVDELPGRTKTKARLETVKNRINE